MNNVSLVYRSAQIACGISIFNSRLAKGLTRRAYTCNDCNVVSRKYVPASKTILHYAPSMWAGDRGALSEIVQEAGCGHLIVILHGMYGPTEPGLPREFICPELNEHVNALSLHAKTIIALSRSCSEAWARWKRPAVCPEPLLFLHPGAGSYNSTRLQRQPYLFWGGVSRSKKDVRSARLASLLSRYRDRGFKVWAHITNQVEQDDSMRLPVWKTTHGILPPREWLDGLANASLVLCPYETGAQCVSGLISEAISVGSRVIASNFPFAREMSWLYPAQVRVEEDLREWASISPDHSFGSLPTPPFPDWNEFLAFVMSCFGGERSNLRNIKRRPAFFGPLIATRYSLSTPVRYSAHIEKQGFFY